MGSHIAKVATMEEKNNSIYQSIDENSPLSSCFNKEDAEDAARRMRHSLMGIPLQRVNNHFSPRGIRYFQDLTPQGVTSENADQGTKTVPKNESRDDKCVQRESSTDSSASDKRSKFRHSGELWPTLAGIGHGDVKDQDGCVEEPTNHPGPSYSRQTSDTGSLPDVILSSSSAIEKSPDLVSLPVDEGTIYVSGLLDLATGSTCRATSGRNGSLQTTDAARLPSEATSAGRKFEIEGRVNDPKAHTVHRQVSFNKQVSVREIDGGIDQLQLETGWDHHEEVFYSIKGVDNTSGSCTVRHTTESRSRVNSADEKRQIYSDRTSGYGTGESSKNSQTGSSESICITSDLEPNPLPMLSILERTSSGTLSSGNQSFQTVQGVNSCKAGASLPHINSGSASYNQAGLPILSILQQEDDSFVISSPGKACNSTSCDEALLSNLSQEFKFRLAPSSSGGEEIGHRSSDFDKSALDTLYQFQRSNSSPGNRPLVSPQPAVISPNAHRTLTKAQTFPMLARDNLQRMREELINNYSEDLLCKINHLSPATDYESVQQKIRAVTVGTSDSSSPSPFTPLTPLVYNGPSPTADLILRQSQNRFSFQSMQTLVLRPEGKKIQTKMLLASRCKTKRCAIEDCRKGKQILSHLDQSMQTNLSDVTYANHQLPVIALLDHSLNCDEMRCTMPFCYFLHWRLNLNSPHNYEDINPRQVVKVLTQFAQLPTLRFTSWEGLEDTLYKLNSQFQLNRVTEGRDWIAMVRMGTYGGTVMATTTTSFSHWIIKKVNLTHSEEDCRLEVYRRLRDHRCPHIVSYLWMIQSGKLLHVCYVFEQGASLHERLQLRGPLHPQVALSYFRQILDAAIFLHGHDILYLYWAAKNLILDVNGAQATCKLCNFSAALCLTEKYEVEEVVDIVPATLLPYELTWGDDVLCTKVDSWGLGCLLAELLTAQPARHDLIHEERCAIQEQLKLDPLPKRPDVGNDIVDKILNSCWKINPRERLSAAQLKDCIHSHP